MVADTPHPVEIHVGARIRLRRKLMGMSQQDLSRAIGLTFQQLQKYEKGTNRISASKLYGVAQALKVSISYFFDGLDASADGRHSEPGQAMNAFVTTNEGFELAEAFPRIRRNKIRQRLLDLVRSLVEN